MVDRDLDSYFGGKIYDCMVEGPKTTFKGKISKTHMKTGFERQKNGKTVAQVTSCTCNAMTRKQMLENSEKEYEKSKINHNFNKILSIFNIKNSVNTDFSKASS